eukprot:GHRQ01018830.1.p2 GENE.GHRQ01018830.1~~GHRQ01018830.1.p2  ORF type:complete len:241 (+),score=65.70 GHRQ01018830.1:812-1534(+)
MNLGWRQLARTSGSHAARPNRRAHTACSTVSVARLTARAQKQDSEEYDLVTRMVGKLFGKAVVEDQSPFGLKRMDWSSVQDLEVTTDRWGDPVQTDDPLMAKVRPLLAGTQLETETLRCAYCATEDGWNPDAFHERVDGYGAALCVARTQGGAVLGGYNPLGFDGYGEAQHAPQHTCGTTPSSMRQQPGAAAWRHQHPAAACGTAEQGAEHAMAFISAFATPTCSFEPQGHTGCLCVHLA